MSNALYQFYATLPSGTPYQGIKLTILEDKQGGGAYNNTFARNTTVLKLIDQVEKDIFELKRNQAALQQLLLSTQPAATPWSGQTGMALAPLSRK